MNLDIGTDADSTEAGFVSVFLLCERSRRTAATSDVLRSDESNRSSLITANSFWRLGMTSSLTEIAVPAATNVVVTDDTITVDLSDGRTISVPLAWYPRLVHGTPDERSMWRLIGRGEGIHWPQLDDDISVEGLIAGKPSGESQASLARWIETRR